MANFCRPQARYINSKNTAIFWKLIHIFDNIKLTLYPHLNSSQPVLPYEWRNRFVSTTVHSINMWFHSYTWNGFSTKFTWYYNMCLFMSINWLWVFKDLVTFITFYIRGIMFLFVMIPQFNYSFDQGNLIKSMDNKTIRRWGFRRLHPFDYICFLLSNTNYIRKQLQCFIQFFPKKYFLNGNHIKGTFLTA